MKAINKNRKDVKIVNFRVDKDLFLEMELIREKLGINWSFSLRDFIQEKINELKPTIKQKNKV